MYSVIKTTRWDKEAVTYLVQINGGGIGVPTRYRDSALLSFPLREEQRSAIIDIATEFEDKLVEILRKDFEPELWVDEDGNYAARLEPGGLLYSTKDIGRRRVANVLTHWTYVGVLPKENMP